MSYRKTLGDWGEAHAERLLKKRRFTRIRSLNIGGQHPGGDVIATKGGRCYFFSVKSRDRFGQNGKPNPGYNIYPQKVIKAALAYNISDRVAPDPSWQALRALPRSENSSPYR